MALVAAFTDVGLLEEMINIGTLSAFVLVSIGVVVLRRRARTCSRAFRVPWSPGAPDHLGRALRLAHVQPDRGDLGLPRSGS